MTTLVAVVALVNYAKRVPVVRGAVSIYNSGRFGVWRNNLRLHENSYCDGYYRGLLRSVFAIVVGSSLLLGWVAAEADTGKASDFISRPVTWKKLNYAVPILFHLASATITLNPITAARVKEQLLDAKGHALLAPKASELLELSMHSDNFGRRSDVRLLFEPNLQVLQLTHLNSGKRNRLKTYRYLENGVWSYLQEPKQNELALGLDHWTNTSEELVTFPERFKTEIIVDNGVLFYLVSALPLDKVGETFEFYSFFNRGIYRLILRVEAKENLELDYKVQRAGKESSVTGESPVFRLALRATPVDAPEAEPYELLGLKGAMYLYVEANSAVLLRLSGDVDYMGQVDISLRKVEY